MRYVIVLENHHWVHVKVENGFKTKFSFRNTIRNIGFMKHMKSNRELRLHNLNGSVKFQMIDFVCILIQYIAIFKKTRLGTFKTGIKCCD